MRRLIVMLLALALLAGAALPASAATGTPIMLNGQETAVTMDANTGVVALDQFAKALGAQYTWEATRHEATVVLGHRSVVVWADSPKAVFNGAIRNLAAAPKLSGNTVLVPAAVVAEALGLYVAGEKDGALALRTGLDLVLKSKAPDFTTDQILKARMVTKMVGSEALDLGVFGPFEMSVSYDLHVYKGQLTLRMQIETPSEPAMAVDVAYVDGKSYMKAPEMGWMETGEEGNPFEELSPLLGDMWTESATPDNPEFASAVITVTGTSEMDGVKVVHVMISKSESTTLPMAGPEGVEGLFGDIEFGGYVQTYAIDPETGIVHEAHSEMTTRVTGENGFGAQIVSDLRVSPVSVPLKLPADFPR